MIRNCSVCGKKAPDPLLVERTSGARSIMCYGCLADDRAKGHTIKVIRRQGNFS